MGQSSSRAARTLATLVLTCCALLGAGACDLAPGGLADALDAGLADGRADGAPFDVETDSSLDGPGVDAADAAPDVITGDAPDSCAPIESDCLDGIDNDCNGQIDCADAACTAGYTCVPGPTGGFTGFAVYDDDRSTPCPPTYPAQADTFEGLMFAPATCSTCACPLTSGATCSKATLTCGASASCTVNPTATQSLGPICSDFAAAVTLDMPDFCSVSTPVATPGTCAPSGGVANKPAVTFAKQSRTCGSGKSGGGCTLGACVAKPPTTSHGVCVAQGAAAPALCPPSYPHAHVVSPTAASFTDTRGCTACGCTGPTGATCSGSATLHTATACADAPDGGALNAPITIAADGVCHGGLVTAPTTFPSGIASTMVTSLGTCAASGGQSTGGVTPTAQTAYCCQN